MNLFASVVWGMAILNRTLCHKPLVLLKFSLNSVLVIDLVFFRIANIADNYLRTNFYLFNVYARELFIMNRHVAVRTPCA